MSGDMIWSPNRHTHGPTAVGAGPHVQTRRLSSFAPLSLALLCSTLSPPLFTMRRRGGGGRPHRPEVRELPASLSSQTSNLQATLVLGQPRPIPGRFGRIGLCMLAGGLLVVVARRSGGVVDFHAREVGLCQSVSPPSRPLHVVGRRRRRRR